MTNEKVGVVATPPVVATTTVTTTTTVEPVRATPPSIAATIHGEDELIEVREEVGKVALLVGSKKCTLKPTTARLLAIELNVVADQIDPHRPGQ